MKGLPQPRMWLFVKVLLLYPIIGIGLFSVLFGAFSISSVIAQPTPTINYQAKLTTPAGTAVPDGTYNLRFYLYNTTGGATTSAIWTEELTGSNRVQVTNGLLSVMLGSTTPLTSVNFNQALYLGVEVGSTSVTAAWDGEMSPRKVLGTVPAAFESYRVGGVASSSFLRSDQADTMTAFLTLTAGASTSDLRISGTATTTALVVGTDRISDLTGTGLIISSNALTVSSSSLNLRLTGLGDVSLAGPSNGQLFSYNGTNWTNVATSTLNINLTNTTGTLGVTRGGTGLTSAATGDLIYASGVNTFANRTIGTTGQVLSVSGGLPTWVSTSSLGLGGGSGTVNSGTSGQVAFYGADGTAVSGTSTLFISTAGNVGIGDVSPSEILSVNGLIKIPTASAVDNNSPGITTVSDDDFLYDGKYINHYGFGFHDFNDGSGNGTNAYIASFFGIDLFSAGLPRLRISTNGNVGIGTTTPSYGLDISKQTRIGWITDPALAFTGLKSGGNEWALQTVDSDGRFRLVDNTSGAAERITFTQSGNVGIGTTTPYARLSVAGNLALTGGIYDNTASLGTSGMILQTTGSGVSWTATSSLNLSLTNTTGTLGVTRGGTGLISVATGDLLYGSGANTLANRTIGTTGQILSVSGGLPTWVSTSTLGIVSSQFTDGGDITYLNALTDVLSIGTTTNVATSTGLAVYNRDVEVVAGSLTGLGEINDGASGATALLTAADVVVRDGYAYATSLNDDGFQILDVSNPNNPIGLGELTDTTLLELNGAFSLDVQGNYAYVTGFDDDGVQIIDISDPMNPLSVGSTTDGANGATELDGAIDIIVDGNYAYVSALFDDGIQVLDISDPTRPRGVGIIADGTKGATRLDAPHFMEKVGNYLYVTNESALGGLQIIDVSNPTNPIGLDEIADGEDGATRLSLASDVAIKGPYAFVVANGEAGLQVLNISNPNAITSVAAYTDGSNGITTMTGPVAIEVVGNYALVTSRDEDGVQVLNIASSTNVFGVGAIVDGSGGATELDGPERLSILGEYVYVAGRTDNGIQILKLPSLTSPTANIGSLASDIIQTDFLRTSQLLSSDGALNVGTNAMIGGALTITGTASSSLQATATSAALVVTSGNVGFGTTTPYAKLSLAGNLALTGGIFDNTASLGTSGMVLQTTGSGVTWVATSSLGISGGGGSSKWTNSGSNIYFNTGSVGIGTTSPSFVATASTVGLNIATSSLVGIAALRLETGTADYELLSIGSNGNFGLYDHAGAAYRLYVSSSTGNIGIGNTAPTFKLDVTGTARFGNGATTSRSTTITSNGILTAAFGDNTYTSSIRMQNNNLSIAGNGTGMSFDLSTGGAAGIEAGRIGSLAENSTFTGTTADAALAFFTSADATLTERLRINSAGNVGIGTSSPVFPLDVYTAGNTFASLTAGAGFISGIQFNRVGTTTAWQIESGRNGINDFSIRQGNGIGNAFTITNNGSIGIGTTSPTSKLEVWGAANTNQIKTFNSTNNRSLHTLWASAGGDSQLSMFNSSEVATNILSTNGVSYLNGGNVGIGSTTPAQLLSVAGNGYFTGGLGVGVTNTAAGSLLVDGANALISVDRSGAGTANGLVRFRIAGSSRGFLGVSGTSGGIGTGDTAGDIVLRAEDTYDLHFATDGGTTRMSIIDGGDVGIGRTDPQKRLDVFETVADSQLRVSYDSTNFAQFQVTSAGDLTIDAFGGDVNLLDENLFVCSGGSCASTPNGTGNITAERSIVSEERTLATSGSITVNWDDGNQQRVSGSAGNMTFTFSNPTAGQTLRLVVCFGGTHTITWSSTIRWGGGSAPAPTSTNGKCDVFSFLYTGTEYLGQASLNF